MDNIDALPDEIILLSEASMKPVGSVNFRESPGQKAFKNGNQVVIDVRDLPRGIHYLHIKNSRRQDEKVDMIRILPE